MRPYFPHRSIAAMKPYIRQYTLAGRHCSMPVANAVMLHLYAGVLCNHTVLECVLCDEYQNDGRRVHRPKLTNTIPPPFIKSEDLYARVKSRI